MKKKRIEGESFQRSRLGGVAVQYQNNSLFFIVICVKIQSWFTVITSIWHNIKRTKAIINTFNFTNLNKWILFFRGGAGEGVGGGGVAPPSVCSELLVFMYFFPHGGQLNRNGMFTRWRDLNWVAIESDLLAVSGRNPAPPRNTVWLSPCQMSKPSTTHLQFWLKGFPWRDTSRPQHTTSTVCHWDERSDPSVASLQGGEALCFFPAPSFSLHAQYDASLLAHCKYRLPPIFHPGGRRVEILWSKPFLFHKTAGSINSPMATEACCGSAVDDGWHTGGQTQSCTATMWWHCYMLLLLLPLL